MEVVSLSEYIKKYFRQKFSATILILLFVITLSFFFFLRYQSSNQANQLKINISNALQEPLRTKNIVTAINFLQGIKTAGENISICVRLASNTYIINDGCPADTYQHFKVDLTGQSFYVSAIVAPSRLTIILLLTFLILITMILFYMFFDLKRMVKVIIEDINNVSGTSENHQFHFLEFKDAKNHINENMKHKMQVEKYKIASQVAHDIRSPLMALNVVTDNMNEFTQEHKSLVMNASKRIQAIADNMLRSYRNTPNSECSDIVLKNDSDIAAAIQEIICEKRLQFKNKKNIKVQVQNLIVHPRNIRPIGKREFERVISNLVNNSIEAIVSDGEVDLSILDNGSSLQIKLADNGIGMDQDHLDKLGKEGFTEGKTDGNGLGVHYALQAVQSWSGKILFNSKKNKGTVIQLEIPVL